MTWPLTFRTLVLLMFLQVLAMTPGFVPTASASWTYLGLFQVGISWGHIVRKHKFRCQTSKHGTYVYYSRYGGLAQAKADATKRCK